MTRNAEVCPSLVSVPTKHLTERLMLAGFVFMRRADWRAASMAAANASARGQRHAILASPLHEPTGFALVVDCRLAWCGESGPTPLPCSDPATTTV
jgi:hypothetical protein